MTSAEELQALREGLVDYVYELGQRYREIQGTERAVAREVNRIADELEQRFLTPPAPLSPGERAGYVNRWMAVE